MRVVVDASVALKWVLSEGASELDIDLARQLLRKVGDRELAMFQPEHWRAEVMSVVARKSVSRIDAALLMLEEIPVIVSQGPHILRAAAQLAAQLKHHLFDTLYHAVALDCGATLLTADEAYFAKARKHGQIALLSNFELT